MNFKALSIVLVVFVWVSIAGCPDTNTPAPDDPNGAVTDGGANDPNVGANDPNVDPNDPNVDGDDSPADDPNDGVASGDNPDDNDPNDINNPDPEDDDPNDPNVGGGDLPAAAAGSFGGQLACLKTESVQGSPGPQANWDDDYSIEIDPNGIPAFFLVPGYRQNDHDMIEFSVHVSQVGDSVAVDGATGSYTATLTATVTEAAYTGTTGHVVLSLEYHGLEDPIHEDGTGTQTIDYTLDPNDPNALTYNATTHYDVDFGTDIITLPTTWGLDCTGTMARE